jgi:hypothetical protein
MKILQATPISFREPLDSKVSIRQVSRELGFYSTTELILTALREYLVKRNIEI